MARLKAGMEMTRVVVRVPVNTLKEMDEYVLQSGLYNTYFYSAALVIGARALMRTVQFPVVQERVEAVDLTWSRQEGVPISAPPPPRVFPSRKGRSPKRTRIDDLREGLIKLDPETIALTGDIIERIE